MAKAGRTERKAALNQQTMQEFYISMGGTICPVPGCHSGNLEGGFVEIVTEGARQPITCLDCGATWTDCYSLVRMEGLEIPQDGSP